MRLCCVENCGRKHCAGGYCNTHYARVRRDGPEAAASPLAKGAWTADELAKLRDVYASAPPLRIKELAAEIGRTVDAVHVRASKLGLGDWHRRKVVKRKGGPMFATVEELRRHQSDARKSWLATNPHPRGALGMKHSPQARAKVAEATRRAWLDPASKVNSAASRQKRSDNLIARIAAGGMRSGYTRSAGGRRADLGDVYFRSAWEANYARYLNWRKARGDLASWEYEPRTFVFEKIKRGTRAYTPDFRLTFPDERVEWHEVKGWMDPKSKTRLARMSRYYPGEVVRVIDETWFRMAKRTGIAAMLPHWESGGRGSRGA